MLFLHRFDFFFGIQCENTDVFFAVLVAAVNPKLVESIGRGLLGIKPDVALFGLAEFAAIGFGDERAGEGESLAVGLATNQLGTGGDIAPLVAATHLQLAVVMLIQVQEIVTLHQLVREFGERHAVAFAVEAFLHGILGHHVVDCDVLANVANEVKERKLTHPVVIVNQYGGIVASLVEIKELLQLFSDTGLVVTQGVGIQQVALL